MRMISANVGADSRRGQAWVVFPQSHADFSTSTEGVVLVAPVVVTSLNVRIDESSMGTKFEELAPLTASSDWQELLTVRGPVQCVALGHPNCQITCAGGECVAFFHEPSGPCIAQCLEGAMKPIRLGEEFSIQLVANNGRPVNDLFKKDLPEQLVAALQDAKEPIHLSGRFTREQFVDYLWAAVRAQQSGDWTERA
jgi:hypothetical protein